MGSKLRANPFICIKVHSERGVVLDDYFSKRTFASNRTLVEVLNFAKSWRDKSEVEDFLQRSGRSRSDLQGLIHNRIILHEDDPLIEFATRCYKWAAFGYRDAAYIHAASFAYPFLNYAEPGAYKLDEHFMNAYRIVADPPSPFKTNSAVIKTYKITKPIDYPSVRFEEVSSLINCPSDSTTRACKASLSSSDLDLFLHFSFGVTKVVTKDGVSLVRKVVPSGGARHPTEAYLIFLTDHFYPRGVYHFNTQDDGQLDALVFQDCGSRLDQALYGVLSQVRQADQEPLFCLVLTSVVRRAMWRYRDIRSSRAVFIDMGHVIQNAENCASLLNLKKLADFPFREKELSCILGIDYLEEPCLRACLFG